MSWSASFQKPVLKCAAVAELDNLPKPQEPAAMEQFQAAKDVAKLLLKSVPGPFVNVSMTGHANAIGWQKKEGWANDMISVSVYQMCDEDMKYFAEKA
jgi:hypothetical protein